MKLPQRLCLLFLIACTVFWTNACRPIQEGMAKTYFHSGVDKRKKGDNAGAMADLDKAISYDPELVGAYMERGALKELMGDSRSAVADFDRAVEKNPSLFWAYMYRGFSKVRLRDYSGALADCSHAILLNPKNAEAYRRRGMIKLFWREDPDGALADFEEVIKIQPSKASGYVGRALVEENRHDLRGAVADLSQAMQLEPNNQEAINVEVRVKRKQGDLDGALNDINRAINARPNVATFYRTRLLLEILLQKWEGVVSDSSRYCELTKAARDYGNLFLWVGYMHLGKMEAANQHLSDYLKSASTDRSADWTNSIAKFLLGRITEEDLLKAASTGEEIAQKGQRCEAWYYAGMKLLAAGDTTAAKVRFQKCVDTKMESFSEYDGAALELKILAGTP